jgi:hypothetical protein
MGLFFLVIIYKHFADVEPQPPKEGEKEKRPVIIAITGRYKDIIQPMQACGDLPPADGFVSVKNLFDKLIIIRIFTLKVELISITITVKNSNQCLDIIIRFRTIDL